MSAEDSEAGGNQDPTESNADAPAAEVGVQGGEIAVEGDDRAAELALAHGVAGALEPTKFSGAPVTVARYIGALGLTYALCISTLLAIFAPLFGAIALAIFAWPSWRLWTRMRPPKGFRALTRAKAGLRSGTPGAEEELLRLHVEAPSPEVQVEAAGELALLAIERGQWRKAVEVLSFSESDREDVERRRYFQRGLLGEVMRSIVEGLSPGAFHPHRVAPAAELGVKVEFWWQTHDPDLRRYNDLLSLLGLLEAEVGGDLPARTRALQKVMSSSVAQVAGGLLLPALSRMRAALPAADQVLRRELADDAHGEKLRMLRSFDPQFETPRVDVVPYRSQLPRGPSGASGEQVALPSQLRVYVEAAVAPEQLAKARKRYMLVSTPAAVGLGYAMSVHPTPLVMLVGGGAMIGLMGVGMVWSRWYLRRRIKPVMELQRAPELAWQLELGRTQSTGVRLRGTPSFASNLVGFQDYEHSLMVSVVECERHLEDADLEFAWDCVGWWFAGLGDQTLDPESMRGVASSLLRVAVLSGELELGERLSRAVSAQTRWWERSRSIHGNAPRALGLARALLAWRRGELDLAAQRFMAAMQCSSVWSPPHWRFFYQRLGTKLPMAEPKGAAARWLRVSSADRPACQRWLTVVMPELAQAGGAVSLPAGSEPLKKG